MSGFYFAKVIKIKRITYNNLIKGRGIMTDNDYENFFFRGLEEYNKGQMERLEHDEIEKGVVDATFYWEMIKLGQEIVENETRGVV